MDGKPIEYTERNDLSFWFPKVVEIYPELVPRTTIVESGIESHLMMSLFDGVEPEGFTELLNRLKLEGAKMGFPCFFRSDQTSAKHSSLGGLRDKEPERPPCFIHRGSEFGQAIYDIIEYTENTQWSMVGCDTWIIRQRLNPIQVLSAFHGLVICQEYRFIVKNGEIAHWGYYWPKEAIKQSARWHTTGIRPDNDAFDAIYEKISKIDDAGYDLLASIAIDVANYIGGDWSVDFLWDVGAGWKLIDMANADQSWIPGATDAPEPSDAERDVLALNLMEKSNG